MIENSLIPGWPLNPGEPEGKGKARLVSAKALQRMIPPMSLLQLQKLSPNDREIWIAAYNEEAVITQKIENDGSCIEA